MPAVYPHPSQSEADSYPEPQDHSEGKVAGGREDSSPHSVLEPDSGNQQESHGFLPGIPVPAHPMQLLLLSSMASSLSAPWIPMFIHMGKTLPQPTVTFGILSHCFGSAQCHPKDAKHQKIVVDAESCVYVP